MRDDVVALYVDPRGPYPSLVREWYDEARDARTYAGPHPVVAHPPCGPWGSYAHLCTKQSRDHGPIAVELVQQWGGVLEQPAGSRLFDWCGVSSSSVVRVDQVAWGHACIKPTWLYFSGVPLDRVLSTLRKGGVPRTTVENASAETRRRTPLAFAAWLLDLAAQARRP